MSDIDSSAMIDTVKPLCPVFGECGGCLYQDKDYQEELSIKNSGLKALLRGRLDLADDLFWPIVPSPKPYHYRNRLDLKLKKTRAGDVFIGFTPVEGKGVIPVEACYIAEERISAFIPELKERAIAALPAKYKNANLTVRCGQDGAVRWGGIGRRSCRLEPEDYFWVDLNGQRIFYSLDTFFQANLSILPKLVDILKNFEFLDKKACLYDLYGGVGLFSMALSGQVGKAVLIEENPASVNIARYNAGYNKIRNMEIFEGKVEDHLGVLADRDLRGNNVIMVDPPRAGLSWDARNRLSQAHQFSKLIYLSCNPETLARDMETFTRSGWAVDRIIPFDFFPKTRHLETLVVLGFSGL